MRLVRLLGDGFEIADRHTESVHVRWNEVDEVRTRKFDAFCFDVLELEFTRTGLQSPVRICEEDPGFWEIAHQLRSVFPTIPDTWLHEVSFPPFATNERLLYRRP